MLNKNMHGGKRAGAGAHKIDPAMVQKRRTVWISDLVWQKLVDAGNGNPSQSIRDLIK